VLEEADQPFFLSGHHRHDALTEGHHFLQFQEGIAHVQSVAHRVRPADEIRFPRGGLIGDTKPGFNSSVNLRRLSMDPFRNAEFRSSD